MCWVRGPSRSAGISLVAGSKATHTHGSCALSRKVVLRQLIQLEMPQVQVTEVDVDLLGVLTRPRQQQANRHLGMPEEQLSIREGQIEIDGNLKRLTGIRIIRGHKGFIPAAFPGSQNSLATASRQTFCGAGHDKYILIEDSIRLDSITETFFAKVQEPELAQAQA